MKDRVNAPPLPRDLTQVQEGSNVQSLLSTLTCCNESGKNLISELRSAASPRLNISSTCNDLASLLID